VGFDWHSSVVEGIGALAGTLTTLAFIPQVVKTWRSRSARDLSTPMLAAFGTGVLLWLVYGLAQALLPVIVSNLVTLGLVVVLIVLKVRAGRT
jgi:MtN3 and saliva related transmembrane protein